jgi:lipoprotein-anchoring transpeptidase ErfK/SrfK
VIVLAAVWAAWHFWPRTAKPTVPIAAQPSAITVPPATTPAAVPEMRPAAPALPPPETGVRLATNTLRSTAAAPRTATAQPPPLPDPEPPRAASASASNTAPASVRHPATNLLEAQIALASHGISPGPIDGVGGAQTAWALRAFQQQHGLEPTGWLDRDTRPLLLVPDPQVRSFIITAEHLARLAPVPATWLGKSEATHLGHETALELAAETGHATPALIRRLNASIAWDRIEPGTRVWLPAAEFPPARRAALARVSLGNRHLRTFDDRGNLLAHFPCSIARHVEKRPVGELHVAVTVKDPNYTFDPEVFPESPEARTIGRKLIIPPGPNNPVGVAWIGLNRPGYGIHGTPKPEEVGRTESHGCFRLANWNADYFRQMAWVGMPVRVEP